VTNISLDAIKNDIKAVEKDVFKLEKAAGLKPKHVKKPKKTHRIVERDSQDAVKKDIKKLEKDVFKLEKAVGVKPKNVKRPKKLPKIVRRDVSGKSPVPQCIPEIT
jgi:DNA polymerase elongation subunit (family B)